MRIDCVGSSQIPGVERCTAQARWLVGYEATCGLHVAWSVRRQVEAGASSVLVRPIGATADDEAFCPDCRAGLLSSEHRQKCEDTR